MTRNQQVRVNPRESLDCIGGPFDGVALPPVDAAGDFIDMVDGTYARRSYAQAFPDDCAADPLLRLLADVWLWVPAIMNTHSTNPT